MHGRENKASSQHSSTTPTGQVPATGRCQTMPSDLLCSRQQTKTNPVQYTTCNANQPPDRKPVGSSSTLGTCMSLPNPAKPRSACCIYCKGGPAFGVSLSPRSPLSPVHVTTAFSVQQEKFRKKAASVRHPYCRVILYCICWKRRSQRFADPSHFLPFLGDCRPTACQPQPRRNAAVQLHLLLVVNYFLS